MAMITSITANNTSEKRVPGRAVDVAHEAQLTERYSALLRLIQSRQAEHGLSNYAVGITSCTRGAGVTTIAVNLAIAAARGGHRRVLLVDANTRDPQIAKLLRITGSGGLTEVLSGKSLVGDCVQLSSIDALSVLPAGPANKALGLDFEVADVVALLDELRSEFDLIVFDLPEADELSESYAFAQVLDGVFLVIAAGQVDIRIARRVTQRFAHSQVSLLGAIYNKHS